MTSFWREQALPLGLAATRPSVLTTGEQSLTRALLLNRLELLRPGPGTGEGPHAGLERTQLLQLDLTLLLDELANTITARLAQHHIGHLALEERELTIDLRDLRFAVHDRQLHVALWLRTGSREGAITCFLSPFSDVTRPGRWRFAISNVVAWFWPEVHPVRVLQHTLTALFRELGLAGHHPDIPGLIADPGWQLGSLAFSIDPLKTIALATLAPLGWKLPASGRGTRSFLLLHDNTLKLRSWDADQKDARELPAADAQPRRLDQGMLAPFVPIDQHLIHGDLRQATAALQSLREDGYQPELLWRLGYALLESGADADLHLLERICRDATGIDPDAPAPLLLRALSLQQKGSPQAASVACRQALRRLDDSPSLWRVAGLVAAAQIEATTTPERAVAALREAIELEPENRTALELLDSIYADSGQHISREELLGRRLNKARDAAERTAIHLDRATLFHQLGRTEDGDEALTRALANAPLEPAILARVATTQNQLGDVQGALSTLVRAANAASQMEDPGLAADFHLQRAHLISGDADNSPAAQSRAMAECRTALTLDPEHRGALVFLAEGLLDDPRSNGRSLSRHAERIESALQLDDEIADVLARLLRMAARKRARDGGKDNELAGIHRHLLRLIPDDDHAFTWLTSHFEERGVPQEAIDIHLARIEALPAEDPRRIDTMMRLANLYESLELPGDALRWLDRAGKETPFDDEIARRRLRLLEELGDLYGLRSALIQLAEHSTDATDKAELVARAGRISLRLQDSAMAQRLLERAVALEPRQREWLGLLRRAMLTSGDLDGAVAVLERLARVTTERTSRRQYLVEAGDILHDEAGKPEKAWAFYTQAQSIRADPALADKILRIERSCRADSIPDEDTRAPGTGPPTDVGPALEGEDWKEEDLGTSTSELPEPISEELEITLTARDAGRMDLQVVGRDSLLDLPETTPTPASATPVAKLPPFRPASLAPSDPDMVVASAQNDRASSEASGRWRTTTHDDKAEGNGDNDATDSTGQKEGFTEEEGSTEGEGFQAPAPNAAPDWRVAAREWTLSPESSTASKQETEPGKAPLDTPADLPAAEDSEPNHIPAAALRTRLQDARRTADAPELAELLQAVIEEESRPERRARLHQELGVLAFHDLDDMERARDHLESAIEDDPDGVGLEYETLAALEGIYEEYHEYEKLLDIYARKLRRGETGEMAIVYRLLMAQLCLEQLDRTDEARSHVRAVLDEDSHNEAALKILAEVDEAEGNFEDAAEHLETLVEHLPTGFERSEVMVTLAELREASSSFEQARNAWQEAVESAADPIQVIDLMKTRCRERDDWEGLLNGLLMEVSILLETDDLSLQGLVELDLEEVPTHQRVPIRQTVREMADILAVKLNALSEAWQLYGRVLDLSPEEPYALERRIELGRKLGQWDSLARDLEQLSAMLLDPGLQFESLAEAARLYRDHLGDANRARTLFAKAVELFKNDGSDTRPDEYPEAANALEELSENVVERVSLGSSPNWRMPTPPPVSLPDKEVRSDELDPHERTDVQELLARIDKQLDESPSSVRRVELLTEKGSVLSRFPETQRDALISFRAALALDPNHVPARLALVDGLLANGEVEQALNHLIVLAQRTPPSRLNTQALGEIVSSVEIIVATGQKGVSQRAQALLSSLTQEDS